MIKMHRTLIWAALLLAGTSSLAQPVQDFAKTEASARSGDAGAMVALGDAYEKGTGVAQNFADAARWYRSAADKGSFEGMRRLGTLYYNGKGPSMDYAEALKWYRAAAAGGNVRALWNIGMVHLKGSGVAQSDAEALSWFRQAAAKGDVNALNSLGVMYHQGSGVTKDDAEAMRLYRLAADKGEAVAVRNMALLYRQGDGVAKDPVEADRLDKAAASPDPAKWRSFVAPAVAVAPAAPPLAVAPAAIPARAENWVEVYEDDDDRWEVDKASIRRGTDNLVYFTSRGGGKSDRAVDCQRRILYSLTHYAMGRVSSIPGWRDKGEAASTSSIREAILQYACANAG